jgi:hypothetical protein
LLKVYPAMLAHVNATEALVDLAGNAHEETALLATRTLARCELGGKAMSKALCGKVAKLVLRYAAGASPALAKFGVRCLRLLDEDGTTTDRTHSKLLEDTRAKVYKLCLDGLEVKEEHLAVRLAALGALAEQVCVRARVCVCVCVCVCGKLFKLSYFCSNTQIFMH